MGFFKTILSKLGIGDSAAAPAPGGATPGANTPGASPAAGTTPATGTAPSSTASSPTGSTTAPPSSTPPASGSTSTSTPASQSSATPVSSVDVVAQLEQRAASNAQKLNWRTSIVDLLKLLDIDSSLTARKELATELGCPANLMGDSAQMNMWLHKEVLKRIAQNGGNIPAELLD